MNPYEKIIKKYLFENYNRLTYIGLVSGLTLGTYSGLRLIDIFSEKENKQNKIEKKIKYKPRKTIDGYLI